MGAVAGGKSFILLFQRCQRNRDCVLSTSLSREDSKFPMICRRVKSLNINTHDLFTADYQEYQAKPGNMSVPVKS